VSIALLTHRYFRARVNNLTIAMEQDAIRLIEIVQGLRHAETSARVRQCSPHEIRRTRARSNLDIIITSLVDIVLVLMIFSRPRPLSRRDRVEASAAESSPAAPSRSRTR
jgi:hypothetical protein